MAEPESPRLPESDQPPTGSWTNAPLFDVAAVEGTAAYPLNPTASLPPTPDDAATVTDVPGRGAETPPPSTDFPQIPGYRVLRVVGGGGMGTVFKAVHIATDRVVALKLINAGWATESDFRIRFAREAKTLAALEHPNIVPVYDAGSWQGLPFLTMKFIAGKTLYHHLDTIRRDLRDAARLLAQVARAVQYLHTKNIVHRDLKPLNILLMPDGTPLVADFGLIRQLDDDSEFTITQIPMGTRQYMSPEQTRGGRENYTFACDIWALGIILYELLAGHRPFGDDDPMELIRQIRHDPFPAIPADRNAPAGLEAIARKCLAKLPTDRYESAEDVAADLERWLVGEVVTAPPAVILPSRLLATPKLVKRPQWAIGVVFILMLGMVLAATWLSSIPKQESLPKRTITERLAARETVELVGKEGLPLVASEPVPGCDSIVSVARDGFCTLTSTQYGAIELSREPLPCRVRLEAEVALTGERHDTSAAGCYAGRKTTTVGATDHHTLFQFMQYRERVAGDEGEIRVTERAAGELQWWTVAPPGRSVTFAPTLFSYTERPVDAFTLRWRVWSVIIDPESITAVWNGKPLSPITADLAGQRLTLLARSTGAGAPQFEPPVFGSGIGLCVFGADAVFRNVRLVPLPSP